MMDLLLNIIKNIRLFFRYMIYLAHKIMGNKRKELNKWKKVEE